MVTLEQGRGREQHGRRPALIIQSEGGNDFSETTIIAAMSMHAPAGFLFRVAVSAEESGLREASTIMLDQLRTISQDRLRECVGHASPAVMEEVDRALHYSLGLAGCQIV